MPNPAKPLALKLIQGTAQPSRINAKAPTPTRGEPEQPPKMTPYAKAQWKKMIPLLDRMGMLHVTGGLALSGLCESVSELRSVRATRDTYQAEDENDRINFVFRCQRQELDRRLKNWCDEFGLTPASRNKVSADLTPQADSFRLLLNKPCLCAN